EHCNRCKASILDEHSQTKLQILKHFVLQSSRLEPQRIPKRARAAPEEIKFGAPVKPIPLCEQGLAMAQLGLPLLSPIGAHPSRDDHADQTNQPKPDTKSLPGLHWIRQSLRRS